MRMDRSQPLTAGDIINHFFATGISRYILSVWGGKIFLGVLPRGLWNGRPFSHDYWFGRCDRLQFSPLNIAMVKYIQLREFFQALRIAVNQELESLERFICHCFLSGWKAGGVIGIISFHSLEDRIVKTWFFVRHICWRFWLKKPITPEAEEVKENNRFSLC